MPRDEIDQLGDEIQRLRVEFERFFNGALKVPPVEDLERLRSRIRELRNRPGSALVDRFRLTQVEARYNSYSDLFGRRLRDQEEGRGAAAAALRQEAEHDPQSGVVLDAGLAPDAVEALYSGLAKGASSVRFDLDSFRSYLDRQINAIQKKTGCAQVRFRLVHEEGETKLKARPLKAG